jgi:hypothetical protein
MNQRHLTSSSMSIACQLYAVQFVSATYHTPPERYRIKDARHAVGHFEFACESACRTLFFKSLVENPRNLEVSLSKVVKVVSGCSTVACVSRESSSKVAMCSLLSPCRRATVPTTTSAAALGMCTSSLVSADSCSRGRHADGDDAGHRANVRSSKAGQQRHSCCSCCS